jgi:hypothetical protein
MVYDTQQIDGKWRMQKTKTKRWTTTHQHGFLLSFSTYKNKV